MRENMTPQELDAKGLPKSKKAPAARCGPASPGERQNPGSPVSMLLIWRMWL